MIKAGALRPAIKQICRRKRCGHQDGKVTVHEVFLAKIRCRHAFLELSVDSSIIVTAQLLGAGLTQQIAL